MENKPTDELDKQLSGVKPEDIDGYLMENKRYMADSPRAFYYYMTGVLAEKNIKHKTVYINSGVGISYGEKILRMEKHTTSRDLIIRLCIAGHFNLTEINRALKLYKMSELYAKNPRDACIIVAINNRMYDLFDVDELLIEKGFEPLSKIED